MVKKTDIENIYDKSSFISINTYECDPESLNFADATALLTEIPENTAATSTRTSPAESDAEWHVVFPCRLKELIRMYKDDPRLAECEVKKYVVAFSFLVDRYNASNPSAPIKHNAAEYLSLSHSCIKDWRRRFRRGNLVPRRRGRPESKAYFVLRENALEFLEHRGPATSVATLRCYFRELGVNEARRILDAFRESCRANLRAEVHALYWQRPGAVWAMDHLQHTVDSGYSCILVVRDLATGYLPMVLPQRSPTDIAVADALEELFIQHGVPMVIKSDNGGGFVGMETQAVLKRWGVLHLRSPALLPNYNGAVEAGMGNIKTTIHTIASQHGRPGRWTCDDVEGARLLINRTLHYRDGKCVSPEELWNERITITEQERICLRQLTEQNMAANKAELPGDFWDRSEYRQYFKIVSQTDDEPAWTIKWNGQMRRCQGQGAAESGSSRNDAGQRKNMRLYYQKLGRRSLSDAMVAMGLLVIRKRVIPLPIKRIRRLKIS